MSLNTYFVTAAQLRGWRSGRITLLIGAVILATLAAILMALLADKSLSRASAQTEAQQVVRGATPDGAFHYQDWPAYDKSAKP
jgi:hypothetical protein